MYCAVWFALSLLGTAGLFLFQGAQFLAVATIVVYAGAILVTFLFVLMLAQPNGRAYYDRVSWEPLVVGRDRRRAGRHSDDGVGRAGDFKATRRSGRRPPRRSGAFFPPITWPIWASSCSAAI